MDGAESREIRKAARVLQGAGDVVALTGAGISTDSGIPDFRGPNGVWTRSPEAQRVSTLRDYLADPEVRREAWRRRSSGPARYARPNSAHNSLARAAYEGWLSTVITQNTDGLHLAAGETHRVLEVHGSPRRWRCQDCPAEGPMRDMLDLVAGGDPDPSCPVCGGITRAAVVLFGEGLDPEVMEAAAEAAATCDVLLAIGTTLSVHPVAGLVSFAVEHGARLIIINRDPTPYDHLADAILRTPIGEAVPRLLGSRFGVRT